MQTFENNQCQWVVLSAGQIGMEKIMTRTVQIAFAVVLLLGGATFALAQNGPPTGGYPPARWNPNLYGHGYHRHYGYHHHYGHHHHHHGYYRY
jgi:hypothetical protein